MASKIQNKLIAWEYGHNNNKYPMITALGIDTAWVFKFQGM
jgi:hypothetical protein